MDTELDVNTRLFSLNVQEFGPIYSVSIQNEFSEERSSFPLAGLLGRRISLLQGFHLNRPPEH
jgi:hypothetical protein